jgi:hypothetical protein
MKAKVVEDRFDIIRRYAKNKEVLDCGCVEGDRKPRTGYREIS